MRIINLDLSQVEFEHAKGHDYSALSGSSRSASCQWLDQRKGV